MASGSATGAFLSLRSSMDMDETQSIKVSRGSVSMKFLTANNTSSSFNPGLTVRAGYLAIVTPRKRHDYIIDKYGCSLKQSRNETNC